MRPYRPVNALEDASVVCDVLEALAVNLDEDVWIGRMDQTLHPEEDR